MEEAGQRVHSSFWSTWMFQYLQLSGWNPQDRRRFRKPSERTGTGNHPGDPPHFCRQQPSRNTLPRCPSQYRRPAAAVWRLTSLCYDTSSILGNVVHISWGDARSDGSDGCSCRWGIGGSVFFLKVGRERLKRADAKQNGFRVSFNMSSLWGNTTNTFKGWDSNARTFHLSYKRDCNLLQK